MDISHLTPDEARDILSNTNKKQLQDNLLEIQSKLWTIVDCIKVLDGKIFIEPNSTASAVMIVSLILERDIHKQLLDNVQPIDFDMVGMIDTLFERAKNEHQ
jgi:hypothetical protein